MKSVSALKSDNFLIASRKFAPLAQMLGGGGRGGEAEFVICAGVRIIGFLQPMVIRWLPYLVNLSPGMINLITGGGQASRCRAKIKGWEEQSWRKVRSRRGGIVSPLFCFSDPGNRKILLLEEVVLKTLIFPTPGDIGKPSC